MTEETNNTELKAVGKILGEPVAPELSENAWKIRSNLFAISVIAISMVLGDLRIDPTSSFLGLKFSGFSDEFLRRSLLLILVYLSIHFLWVTFDSFLEWRLRITGTRLSFITTGMFASEHADYPNDPRQSTLYSWWNSEAKRIGDLGARLPELERLLQNLEQELRSKYTAGADATNIVNACRPIGEAREHMMKLDQSIKEVQKALTSARVPVSLKRFDDWFQLFSRSQNLRWLVIEFLVPIFLAGYAIYLLYRH